ncbi:MAG: DoxX family protein, partial [Candidatus Acidiferrum sp.]
AFTAKYDLDVQQKSAASVKLEQAEADFVRWLEQGKKQIAKDFPSGQVEVIEANTQRLAEYREKLRQLRDVYAKELPAFGRDVEKKRLIDAKRDLARLRAELQADLDEQTKSMRELLDTILNDSQRKMVVPATPSGRSPQKWLDETTAYFLLGVGVCLFLGLFTRTSCVLAAAFLWLTYLTAPAFPWLPIPPNQEGNYFFISKNVVEMLALLALATTPSGRWLGVDSLFHMMRLAIFGQRDK